MKIGLVLSKTPHYSETFFISKIKGLQESGYELILFVQNADREYNLSKVVLAPTFNKDNKIRQILRCMGLFTLLLFKNPSRLLRFYQLEKKAGRSIVQIIKNVCTNYHLLTANVDWLHFGFATIAIQSENVAQTIGAKLAVSLRGFDVDIYPLEQEGCYDLLWLKVDKVHAISKYTLSKGLELGLTPETSSQIINPAVDLKVFNQKRQEISNSNTSFLTVGRLHPIKGLKYVLKAFDEINRMGIPFTYKIVGSGPLEHELKTLIDKLNLNDRVDLVGQVKHGNILKFYQSANYYIQYSLSEGFCNATLEAQAMGLFCIVSNGGALPENVIDRKTGWVVPKRNVKALVNSITEVLNLPEAKKNEIKMAAIKRVSDHFNMEDYHKKFDSFYS